MVDWVIEAVVSVVDASSVWICVSSNTPVTERHAVDLGFKVYRARGAGYVEDMADALNTLGLNHTLVVPSDTPLIRSSTLASLVQEYARTGKESITLCADREASVAAGLSHEYCVPVDGREVCPVGVAVVNGSKIHVGGGNLSEAYYVWPDPIELINVNTPRELSMAQRLIQQYRAHM
jgi:GTP:adenosylcobinamide-phosphate guanylyltransferase